MILTSNTEATENKVQFLNLAYTVKGFQCHSNNSLQLLELKEKNRNGSPVSFHVLTAPVKELKKVNNSISRVIRVLIDKQRILFSEVWDGVDNRTNTKTRGSKYKNALRTSIYK